MPIIFLSAFGRTPEYPVLRRVVGASGYLTNPFDPWVLRAKVEAFIGLSQRLDGPSPSPAVRPPGCAGILAGLEARLSRLETTVPRLEDGLAGASRAELAGIAAELARQVCDLRAAADALTRACQVGDDLSVGVPPDACARCIGGRVGLAALACP